MHRTHRHPRARRHHPQFGHQHRRRNRTRDRDLGQATTEYALVLLGAATLALVLIGWAGSGRISGLLNHVIDSVTSGLH